LIQNLSLSLASTQFISCLASRSSPTNVTDAGNVYGGSFSLYIGSYSWGRSRLNRSEIVCGSTTAMAVSINVYSIQSSNCSAQTSSFGTSSRGTNVYGGSLSILYIGAFASSRSGAQFPSKVISNETVVTGVNLVISDVRCSGCSAITRTFGDRSRNSNAYGGFINGVNVGVHLTSWSETDQSSSSIACRATSVSDVHVTASNSRCYNCSAFTGVTGKSSNPLGVQAYGSYAYGGSMNLMHVGAFAWSFSNATFSSSNVTCEATFALNVSIVVSNSSCFNCSALSISEGQTHGSNTHGGCMSIAHIGAFAYSFALGSSKFFSRAHCDATVAKLLSISVENLFSNLAQTISRAFRAACGCLFWFFSCFHFFQNLD
jgi:hypothetical protein